jgi:hypothetical protein
MKGKNALNRSVSRPILEYSTRFLEEGLGKSGWHKLLAILQSLQEE